MKTTFTRFFNLLLLLVVTMTSEVAMGQIFNPNDPIVTYNPSAPPALPAGNTPAKWVKTDRLGWNTSSYKCYIYNGIQFRLKYPKTYLTDAPGTTYPLLMFFHGVGERGSIYDNEFQLFHGGQTHSDAVDNGTFNGFLLYPQSSSASGGWNVNQLDMLANLIRDWLVPQVRVDPFRVIVNGLSGGGGATWEFMTRQKMLTAASIPMSGTSITHKPDVANVIYNAFWISNGGLDNSPAPATVTQVINEAIAQGANYKYTFFPNLGHGIWNDFWAMPEYFPYVNSAHKANPWARYGRTEFCPGDNINVTIGVTPGFSGYQWKRNGILLANNGNTVLATDTGTYECRVQYNSTWSVWSPKPVKITYKTATVSPPIQVSGLASNVLPSPDGKTSVDLQVPTGYTSYIWQKLNPTTTLPVTTNKLTGATVGSYQVKVTEQYGCSSIFSTAFDVINAAGANPPPAANNLIATALSQTEIRLNWSLQSAGSNVETKFEIYQSLATAGQYKLIGFAPARIDSFKVTNLEPNVRYYYKIRAVNATAASAVTPVSSALTFSDNSKPTPPANLRTGAISQSSVELKWDASIDNSSIKNYDVYVNGVVAYTISGDLISYTVYNLNNGQYNKFTLVARDLAGNLSSPSNQVVAAAAFSGLNYKHYTFTGTWNTLPDFSTLTPVATGLVPNVTIGNRVQDDNFAYLWEGYVQVPVNGSYTFRTNSDDGSKLYLGTLNSSLSPYTFGGTALVNNDGLHAGQNADGTITLTAGTYPIAITFYEQGGGEAMTVSWKTPQTGGNFVSIPDAAFAQAIAAPGATPAAPSALTATPVSAKKINLTWTDNSDNETSFELYRSENAAGPFNIFTTVPANTSSYSDSSLTASTTYYYRVRAINNNGGSAYDKVGGGVTYSYYELDNLSALPNFNGFTPKKTGQGDNFDMTTRDRSDNFQYKFSSFIKISTANTYSFFTSSDDGSKLYIGAFDEAHLVVNNDGLHGTQEASGTKYLTPGLYPIYVTFFERDGGEALEVRYSSSTIAKQLIPSSVLGEPMTNATTLALPVLPLAPVSLIATTQGAVKVNLAWTNQALPANVTSYEIWHSVGTNSNYELAAKVSGSTAAYLDSSLAPSTTYYFKVRAENEGGFSAYSNEVIATTAVAPVTVVTLPAIPNQTIYNDTTVVLSLQATSDLGTNITYTATGLPSFATLSSTGATTGSITIKPGSEHLGVYNVTVTATDEFAGSATKIFTITVGGKNQVAINLNFNQTLPQAAPWNNMNSAPNNGVTVSNLKDVNGTTTSIGVTLLTTFTGTYSNAVTTGNNSGVFPDNVMKTMYFGSNNTPYQFRLTGLSPNKKYSLIIHAGYPWTATQQTQSGTLIANYTAGGQTLSLNAANNTSQTIRFNGISPDANGYIVVSMVKAAGSGYAIINAMQIIAYDGPLTPSVLNPPTLLKANGISADKIKLNWQADGQTRTGFEIWRSTTPGGTYTLRGTVSGTTFTYTDLGLTQGNIFFYKVRSVNSGVYSAYTSYAGGSTVSYVINLNMNSQAVLSQAAPWNNINTLTFAGYTLPNMVNDQNQPTGIDFNVNRNFTSFHDGVGITTGNNSGVVPDNVMKTLYYMAAGDTSNFTISGLNRTHIYNLEFFAGTTFNYSSVSQFKIGNEVVTLEGQNNTTNTVSIYGVKPDSTGTISIWFTTASMYGMFNSLSIDGMVSPETIADDSAEGMGARIAATSSNLEAVSIDMRTVESAELKAYPNPFVDNITLKLDLKNDNNKFTVLITDMLGRTIQRMDFSNVPKGIWQKNIRMDGSLKRGMYIINLSGIAGEKPKVFKLMK